MEKISLKNNEEYTKRLGGLKQERADFFSHWKEITQYLLPRSGRYFLEDRNKGDRRNLKIIDREATRALGVMTAGMMAGMSSPARKWFRLTLGDKDLAEFHTVKVWLNIVSDTLLDIFARSNTYRVLHSIYEEMGSFGTACSFLFSDYEDLIRLYPQTAGEYFIAQNNRQVIDTVYREFQMQVGPMAQEFGVDKLSKSAKALYDRNNLDAWITLVHAIGPRKDRDMFKRDNKNMPWESVFIEKGSDEGKQLRVGGYRKFPCLTPRWVVRGGDIYGSDCPGMTALGDIKQLQDDQLKKAKGLDYQVDPPLSVPSRLKGSEDFLPGGINYDDPVTPHGGIRTAFEVQLDLNGILLDIQDVRNRINSAFYVDLFQMISNSDRRQVTATEIERKQEEKLLILGPMLERSHDDIFDPLINQTFDRGIEENLFPPPPDELEGQEIRVEYVSMLAQAQKAVGIGSIDRLLVTVGGIAQAKPEVLDKLNTDELVDQYSSMLGVSPDLIIANEEVAIIRDERKQEIAAAQQAEALPAAAQTAKTLGDVDSGNLSEVVNQFTQL